jgi:hypothetical protein
VHSTNLPWNFRNHQLQNAKHKQTKANTSKQNQVNGKLRNPFPRIIGPNATKYLKEILAGDICQQNYGCADYVSITTISVPSAK